MTGVPEGFTRVDVGGEYIRANGPLWIARTDRVFRLGFRVERRHSNGMRICHGGMIATFCDMLLPMAARNGVEALGSNYLPSINLQVDFIGPAMIGAWVEGEAQVLRSTGRMVFMQGLVRSDGVLVARTSGLLKIGRVFDDARPSDA